MDLNNRIAQWKQTPFDKKTQDQVGELEKSPIEAEDAFYKDLEFGTGGMRGEIHHYHTLPLLLEVLVCD